MVACCRGGAEGNGRNVEATHLIARLQQEERGGEEEREWSGVSSWRIGEKERRRNNKPGKARTSLIALRSFVVSKCAKSRPPPLCAWFRCADVDVDDDKQENNPVLRELADAGGDCEGDRNSASMWCLAKRVLMVPSSASASRMPRSPRMASSSLSSVRGAGAGTGAGAGAEAADAGLEEENEDDDEDEDERVCATAGGARAVWLVV